MVTVNLVLFKGAEGNPKGIKRSRRSDETEYSYRKRVAENRIIPTGPPTYSRQSVCRPAGRCLQLVQPIRGKGMDKRGLISLSNRTTDILQTKCMQARRKVFAIGAANSGEGDGQKGVNFTIITCADPVPGKKLHNRHQEAHLGAILRCVRSILALLYYSFLHALFLLQINPILNVIMMIPTKTLAPKMMHQHHF